MAQKVTYKANSKEDIEALVEKIRSIPEKEKMSLVSDLLFLGLMNIRNETIEQAVNMMRTKKSENSVQLFVGLASGFDRNFTKTYLGDACSHAIGGFDTEDEDSVGGWSQREIDLLVEKRNW